MKHLGELNGSEIIVTDTNGKVLRRAPYERINPSIAGHHNLTADYFTEQEFTRIIHYFELTDDNQDFHIKEHYLAKIILSHDTPREAKDWFYERCSNPLNPQPL